MKERKVFIIILAVAFLLSGILYILKQLNFINLILMLLFFITIYIFVYYYSKKIKLEYDKVNRTIEAIYDGDLNSRVISKYVSYRQLNANLNRLARKIETMTFKKEEDELTIKILTNNITSPIIYVDRDGRIRYVNHQFLNYFDVNVEINDIYETLRIRKLFQFIDNAFINEQDNVDVISIHDKYYQANAIPINNNQSNHFTFIGILFIFHDITELKKYETLQREFLADASHELKTPISAIKGASEILLTGDHSKETIKDFLLIIKNENERMERIVRDILLISRLENEKILIQKERIKLKELILSVVEILHFRWVKKQQNIHLDLLDDVYIEGDYNRLKHVFLNLISNAINYTNEQKSIYVLTYKKGNDIKVSIKDEGIGMEKEDLPHIFERFYRIDKARSRETGGTGLGLAIVKSTLDIHKAKIEVKSEIKKGTEFIITFKK